jgi:hypothetical protein
MDTGSCIRKPNGCLGINTGFPENVFIKHGNGILGGSLFYAGRLAVIKGSGLVNSRDSVVSEFRRQLNS